MSYRIIFKTTDMVIYELINEESSVAVDWI